MLSSLFKIKKSRDFPRAVVPRHPLLRRKLSPALLTRIPHPVSMCSHMVLQPIWPNKRLVAQPTNIGLHPRVTPHMHSQPIPIHKFLITPRTLVILLLAVRSPQMIIQVPITLKNLRTDLADARFLGMRGHVDVQSRGSPARIVTTFALVESLVAVGARMHGHCSFWSEALAAGLANVVSLAGVEGDYVLLEGGVGGEAAGALGAPEISLQLCNCTIYIVWLHVFISVQHQVQLQTSFEDEFAAFGARELVVSVVFN